MQDTINGETVYVCLMHEEGRYGYHDRGVWHVMGAVVDLEDAARWAYDRDGRKFTEVTIGRVYDRF